MSRNTCLDVLKASSCSVDCSRIGGIFTHFDAERGARDVHSVKFSVDFVNAILARHETHRVLFQVDNLHETVVFMARGADDLEVHNIKGRDTTNITHRSLVAQYNERIKFYPHPQNTS